MNYLNRLLFIFFLFILTSCGEEAKEKTSVEKEVLTEKKYKTIGAIERISSEINSIIPENAVIEVLGTGMVWSEGPLWIPEKKWLLCSDVKEDKIYRWSEENGFDIYLEPSGFTGDTSNSRERGSNGLTLDSDGNLVMCQHGNRQVAKMNAPLDSPQSSFIPIASNYKGKRFNSPNDLIYDSKGNLYFTDPPYGLSEEMMNDPNKELAFQGIFKVDTAGIITLLSNKISRPNGLALSPDEKTLYVSNTDETNAAWYAFDVLENGNLGEPTEIYNATSLIGKEVGYPDGVKVDNKGNIFTAGPGGLWVFNAAHQLIGKIKPGEWVSNCNFDENYETLYITADDYLLRVKLK